VPEQPKEEGSEVYIFQHELLVMREMGFNDNYDIRRALTATNGKIDLAISQISKNEPVKGLVKPFL
jgi:hypothetical protein